MPSQTWGSWLCNVGGLEDAIPNMGELVVGSVPVCPGVGGACICTMTP